MRSNNCCIIITQGLMIATQVLILCSMKKTFEAEECQRVSNWYFEIYRHYKEDMDALKPSDFTNLDNKKIKTEMERIAHNTIRHFSFEHEIPNLVYKSLEAILSYQYPTNEKNILSTLSKSERPKLKDIISALRKDNSEWPDYKDYKDWEKKDKCF